jgi:four helix bundle protein
MSIQLGEGKRRYERHFISKLTDADAEQMETQHWLSVAASCSYLSRDEMERVLSELASVGRMLNSMMRKADQFCRKSDMTDQLDD